MNRKARIVVVGLKGLPAHGGAATVGQNIINELKNNFDFTVLSVSSHTDLASGNYNGCEQIVFNGFGKTSLNTFIYYLRCLFHCIFNKYDLVHLHHAESGFIVPILKLKYKVIVTFHGNLLKDDPKFSRLHNKFFRYSEKLNMKYANKVVSVSKPDSIHIYNKYKKEITYIPNSITIPKGQLSSSPVAEPYLFFSAGRIYQIKGLHLLLKTVKKINLRMRILIAGDLNQVPAYKDEIMLLTQGLDVTFLGLIKIKEELLNVLTHAEIFIFPSLTEAMSIMLLEAVSTKVPVIASDIPSNKNIFNEAELLFFESDNINDLAEKIQYALENKNIIREFANNAYKRLVTEYTGEIIGEKYLKIYNDLLN